MSDSTARQRRRLRFAAAQFCIVIAALSLGTPWPSSARNPVPSGNTLEESGSIAVQPPPVSVSSTLNSQDQDEFPDLFGDLPTDVKRSDTEAHIGVRAQNGDATGAANAEKSEQDPSWEVLEKSGEGINDRSPTGPTVELVPSDHAADVADAIPSDEEAGLAIMRARRVRDLQRDLQNAEYRWRETAVLALANVGKPAVPHLILALKADDPATKEIAAEALARLGRSAAAAEAALVDRLEDSDPDVRRLATVALGRIGPAATCAANRLRLRGTAEKFEALFRIQGDIEPLVAGLSDSDAKIRAGSATMLGQLGAQAAAATSTLLHAMVWDPNDRVRDCAKVALIRIGKPAAPKLVAWVRDYGDDRVIEVLGTIGPSAAKAIPVLETRLRDRQGKVNWTVAIALLQIQPSNAKAKQMELESMTDDGDDFLRSAPSELVINLYLMLEPYGRAIPHSAAFVPLVLDEYRYWINSAHHQDRADTDVFASLLASMVNPAALTFIDGLEDPSESLRYLCLKSLRLQGPSATAMPGIVKLLESEESYVRVEACYALASMGRAARSAAPALRRLMKVDVPSVREAAVRAVDFIEWDNLATSSPPLSTQDAATSPGCAAEIVEESPTVEYLTALQNLTTNDGVLDAQAVAKCVAAAHLDEARVPEIVSAIAEYSEKLRCDLAAAVVVRTPRNRLAALLLERALREQWFDGPVLVGPPPQSVSMTRQYGEYVAKIAAESRRGQVRWLLHALRAESRDVEERLHQAIDAAAADRDLLIKVARQENSGLSRAAQIALRQLRGLVPTPSDESPFAGSETSEIDGENLHEPEVESEIGPNAAYALPELASSIQGLHVAHLQPAADAIAAIDPYAYGATVVLPNSTASTAPLAAALRVPAVDERIHNCAPHVCVRWRCSAADRRYHYVLVRSLRQTEWWPVWCFGDEPDAGDAGGTFSGWADCQLGTSLFGCCEYFALTGVCTADPLFVGRSLKNLPANARYSDVIVVKRMDWELLKAGASQW